MSDASAVPVPVIFGGTSRDSAAGTGQKRNMALTSKQRAELRAEANHLVAIAHIGQHGITDTVLQSLDDALRTRELIKVHLVKNASLPSKGAATRLAEQLEADVVQVIGRTVSLYRVNPELPRKPGAPPHWRR
jgi:RNA-binding protein